ncbi:MAG: methionyl-tRNA formyltransferase [Lachnospiraceae bacterium]|jgi:methionyl-tRNA formyltransferase|nr:methionyl-tRNA formyltransferase [Lachnospiraceae bacterium]
MRIIFMGTPAFAVPVLDALRENGQEICLAVTQPDRESGRGREVQASPVKTYAQKWGIPVFQPERVKRPEAVEKLREAGADLIVVAAFGQLLSQEILDLPRLGCINVHASLLPKYRGAAPIQWAVIDGVKETGVTIMQMDAGLDTGDILAQERVPLESGETGGSLYEKLSSVGGKLLVQVLPEIEAGTVHRVRQDEAAATKVSMLRKEMGEIDWSRDAASIERQIRGMQPWPGAYTLMNGRRLKVYAAEAGPDAAEEHTPGTVLEAGPDALKVSTGKGVLGLLEVQAEGKKRMPVREFLRGSSLCPGDRLGRSSLAGK